MAATLHEWGQPDCDICGEPLGGPNAEVAEMFDPECTDMNVSNHVICHAQCGIDRGLEVA
jgi:hypothetical protein